MRADLHMHTVYSDGSYSPEELARRCKQAGVQLISMTDHDNMGGLKEKREAAEKYGLQFVSGWEISSYDGCKVHVLGYGCRDGELYEKFLEERRAGALVRADDMRKKANAYFGLSVTMDDIEREHLKKNAPLHTMHVVRAFATKISRRAGETYLEYFDFGKPAYSDLFRPLPEHAIDIVHALGGVAVLAHPGRIRLSFGERESLMSRLADYGLDGIECTYTTHTLKETEYLKAFAIKRGLFETGGSDFHTDDHVHLPGNPVYFADERFLSAIGIPS